MNKLDEAIAAGGRNDWVATLHPFLRDLPATGAFELAGGVGLAYTDAYDVPRGAFRSNGFIFAWEPDLPWPPLSIRVPGLPEATAISIAEMWEASRDAFPVVVPAVVQRGLCGSCGPCPACGGVGIVECRACDDGGKTCQRCSGGRQAMQRTADCAACFGTGREWANVGGIYRTSDERLTRIAPRSTVERLVPCSLLAYCSRFHVRLCSYDDSDERWFRGGLMRFDVDGGRVVGLVLGSSPR